MNPDLARYYLMWTNAQAVYDSIRNSKGPREATFRCITSTPTPYGHTTSKNFMYGWPNKFRTYSMWFLPTDSMTLIKHCSTVIIANCDKRAICIYLYRL